MANILRMHAIYIVLLLLVYESFCKIDMANSMDSIDHYESNFEVEKKDKRVKKEKSKMEKVKAKRSKMEKVKAKRSEMEKCMRSPASKHDKNETVSDAFEKIRWNKNNSSSSSSSSSSSDSSDSSAYDISPPKDNLPVLEASKKYDFPNVIVKCVRKGDIALTFDDGVSKVTKDVLDILRRENVKATFFILGNTLDSPVLGEKFAKKILNQMIEDGHVIASHSYSHPDMNTYWPEGIYHEMNRADGLFIKHIGLSPRFMRPPFGNASPRTIQALHDLGYFIIGWNVDTNDWMHTDAPDKSLREFSSKLPDEAKINNIRWQKNGLTELGVKTMINNILDSKIALMHDIHPGISHFLPRLIQHARALGYQFVSMDDCLGGVNPYFESQ